MKVDFDETTTLTKWQIIQIVMVCLAIASFFTMLNTVFGYIFIGGAVIVFALPIIVKIFGAKKDEGP